MESTINKPCTKNELFKELANFDSITSVSRFVNTNEFVNKYSGLQFGNGGSWARLDGDFGRNYKVCIVKTNGTKRLSWNPSDEETICLEQELTNYLFTKGTSIMLIKIVGLQTINSNRYIPKWIKDVISKKTCVVCGTNSMIEVDHKNSLFNDTKVLTLCDFQPLCKHCNDQKRQTCVWQKIHKKRYPVSMIPQLSVFEIDFIQGDETYDETNPETLVGTYWYDPVEFMKRALILHFIKTTRQCCINEP